MTVKHILGFSKITAVGEDRL